LLVLPGLHCTSVQKALVNFPLAHHRVTIPQAEERTTIFGSLCDSPMLQGNGA
jgi:hypothetical protein